MRARRGCGCLVTSLFVLGVLIGAFHVWANFEDPPFWEGVLRKAYPHLRPQDLASFRHYEMWYSLAITICLIFILRMKKWAFYGYVLLGLLNIYACAKLGFDLSPSLVTIIWILNAVLTFVILWLSDAWYEMD